jgi:hypothetical protein
MRVRFLPAEGAYDVPSGIKRTSNRPAMIAEKMSFMLDTEVPVDTHVLLVPLWL